MAAVFDAESGPEEELPVPVSDVRAAGVIKALTAAIAPAQGAVTAAERFLRPVSAGSSVDASLEVALDAAAVVEDLARRVEYLQLVAADAVARAHALPDGAGDRGALGSDGASAGPLSFGAASVLASIPTGDGVEAAAASAGRSGSGDDAAAAADGTDEVTGTGTGRGRRGQRRTYRRASDALRVRLRCSGAEARRRIGRAADLLPGVSPTGAVIPSRFAGVATLVAEGAGDSAAVGHVLRGLHTVERVAEPERLAAMEEILVGASREVDADEVRRLTDRCVHLIDQDGPEPSEAEVEARQGVFDEGRRRGLHQLRILVDDVGREVLDTIFAAGTNPRSTGCVPVAEATNGADAAMASDSDMADAADAAEAMDPCAAAANEVVAPGEVRTRARQRLDALLAACGSALRTKDLPATGGLPTQVMVTVGLAELCAEAGSAFLPYVGPVPARHARRLACDADVIPVVLGGAGQVLDVGQGKRLFPPHLRRTLAARDGGCAFPGCHVPAPWTEGHHLVEWWNGGATSIENGVLVCPHHHHVLHDRRWAVTMRNGVPVFHPPDGRSPTRNRYHRPPLPPNG